MLACLGQELPDVATALDEADRRILNRLQQGFPVCDRPYAAAARELDMDEAQLLARIESLLQRGVLTRFGPLYNADRMGGGYILAAMAVPEESFEQVAAIVNAQPEIAHNYRREHRLNMWFVAASDDPARAEAALARIEALTGLSVLRLPKEREYGVDLRFEV